MHLSPNLSDLTTFLNRLYTFDVSITIAKVVLFCFCSTFVNTLAILMYICTNKILNNNNVIPYSTTNNESKNQSSEVCKQSW